MSAIDQISKATGLRKSQMEEIWKAVKANCALLDACAKHDFSTPVDRRTKQPIPERVLFCDWRCKNCGGHVDGIAKQWYELGLKHGKL